MKMPAKLQDIVDYVLAFRKGKAFETWSAKEITYHFYEGYKRNEATAFVDEAGVIGGVVIGKIDVESNTFHIVNLLTTDRRALPSFVKLFRSLYSGYNITGNRNNKKKLYNTPLLCNKILKLT